MQVIVVYTLLEEDFYSVEKYFLISCFILDWLVNNKFGLMYSI